MKVRSHGNRQVYGETVLARLVRSPHAAALKKDGQVFKVAQAGYVKAEGKVAAAQAERDEAIANVGAADDVLDKALLVLADRLVGAGLGKRKNPFTEYSDYSPARLTALAYADEAKAAQELVTALGKKKLPADTAAATKAVAAQITAVKTALKEVAAPQAEYEAAIHARDNLLLGWNKTLERLKRAAAVAYDDDKTGYRALFAPAQDLQLKKRAPNKKNQPSTPTPPAP